MTILGTLRAEVQEALRHGPTNTLLWLDPQHEWERLLDQLATEHEVVKYDGSQLELRVKIEAEPVQTSRIVYLTASGMRARLFDDEQVVVFLGDPESVVDQFKRDGALAVFRDYLAEAFGVSPDPNVTPSDVAQRLVQNLILSEAAEHGGGEVFPYRDRLPAPSVRERCLRFLSRWLEARTQAQTAGQLIHEAEEELSLAPWAITIEPIPDIQSSLSVERALVQRVLSDFQTQSSLDARASSLAALLPVFQRHASHFGPSKAKFPNGKRWRWQGRYR